MTHRSRLRFTDTFRLAALGLRASPGRALLTALGVAIGIAAVVAVVGISASGRAELLAQLDRLGTNLLRVGPGQGVLGGPDELPVEAGDMALRIRPVQAVTEVSRVDATVRRTDLIGELETGGLGVVAVQPDLVEVLGARVREGRFLDAGMSAVPAGVLGSVAAERLGIPDLSHDRLVYVDGTWITVIGIVDDLGLHPDLERSLMVGDDFAAAELDDPAPTAVFMRVFPEQADAIVEILPRTINPENPDRVEITRPSDALAAREAADTALTQLLIGLGSVALVVGGVAVANIMVMSVLERRMEIGVRRALGATRGHIRRQFLVEAALIAVSGGVAGVTLGAAVVFGFAEVRETALVLPLWSVGAAMAAAVVVGLVAGLYPAGRAARIPPSAAVRGAE